MTRVTTTAWIAYKGGDADIAGTASIRSIRPMYATGTNLTAHLTELENELADLSSLKVQTVAEIGDVLQAYDRLRALTGPGGAAAFAKQTIADYAAQWLNQDVVFPISSDKLTVHFTSALNGRSPFNTSVVLSARLAYKAMAASVDGIYLEIDGDGHAVPGFKNARVSPGFDPSGLDSHAGWVATVDGASGAVFAQRFVFDPGKDYPDGSSVEFWLNGVGRIHAYNEEMVMLANEAENPYVFESEVLSPLAERGPGQSYTWRYDWYACRIGPDLPVLGCTDAGVVAEPLAATVVGGGVQLRGRFGVFAPGHLEAVGRDERGREAGRQRLSMPVSPLSAAPVDATIELPRSATTAVLTLVGTDDRCLGEFARGSIRRP